MDVRVTADGVLRWPGGQARAALGRSGLRAADAKREGDGATPIGAWPFRQVFWRADRVLAPHTRLALSALQPDDGWCDAPADRAYNRPVKLPYPASAEAMWRDDALYDILAVLGYNDAPPRPGVGSAIFLHVAQGDYRPTEGCVAVATDDLRRILAGAGPEVFLVVG